MRGAELPPVIRAISVDDSPVMAERLAQMFEDVAVAQLRGHAHNISAALQLIRQEKPEVVILDIHLEKDHPGNGIDLLTTLRKKYPALKIIMLTNLSQPQYRDTCLRLGADYFLDKTLEFDKIPEILQQISMGGN